MTALAAFFLFALPQGEALAERAARAHAEAVEALGRGDTQAALHHLMAGLRAAPADAGLVRDLVALSGEDEQAAALWSLRLAGLVADSKGRLPIGRNAVTLLPDGDPGPARAAAARFRAAAAVAKAAGRLKPGDPPSLAAWCLAAGRELCRGRPVLEGLFMADIEEAAAWAVPDDRRVVQAVGRAMAEARTAGRVEDAAEAALILTGLAAQTGFKHLKDSAPDLSGEMADASRTLKWVSDRRAEGQVILTVQDLLNMDPEEILSFNALHADPANPAVGVSPEGLYRVETTAGHSVLLAALDQVDLHHARLVDWSGSDPFEGRQGTVRIVPGHDDLEEQGTPFWWAGGFQRGDLTVLRTAVTTPGGMGRGLVHELTHRFDGGHFGGLPAWLSEGRAVWTASAYALPDDVSFEERYADLGRISHTSWKGYARQDKLEELVTGAVDDYRDNYFAGHALWVYLNRWEEAGRPLFAGRLERYMRVGGPDLDDFEDSFADGKEGRPQGMEAFAAGWGRFIGAIYRTRNDNQPPPAWLALFVGSVQGPPGSGEEDYFFDAPTWPRTRSRAEPVYGQDQAGRAGLLLARLGRTRDAARALEWSLVVDEDDAVRLGVLIEAHRKLGESDGAFAAAVRRGRVEGQPGNTGLRPGKRLLAAVKAVRALESVLETVAETHGAENRTTVSRALHADVQRLAAWSGDETAAPPPGGEPGPLHPACEPAFHLGAGGWTEDQLTGHDDDRSQGAWHVDDGGTLVVGARGGRTTSGLERSAWYQPCYVRSSAWMDGAYSVKVRIRLVSSYADGTIVIGSRRRDRNFRVGFSAGDFGYAIGKREEVRPLESVSISFGDLRERDPALPGVRGNRRRVEFDTPRATFEVEVLVRGAWAHVFVDGVWQGAHHAADGVPIAGQIGFAVKSGAYAVVEPQAQWHRALAGESRCLGRSWPLGIDPGTPGADAWDRLGGRPTSGLPIGPRGTVVIWISEHTIPELEEMEESGDVGGVASVSPWDTSVLSVTLGLRRTSSELFREGLSPLLVVAVPDTAPAGWVERFENRLGRLPGDEWHLVRHRPQKGFERWKEDLGAGRIGDAPWLLFLDEFGIVRSLKNLELGGSVLGEDIRHWGRMLAGQ